MAYRKNITPENEQFTCNCSDGETRIIAEERVDHKCGFRPSANYGSLGRWTPYRRVQINGTDRFNWFVDYQSTPKVTIIPKFQVGQRVKAIAFTDCFDKFVPERTGLIVTEIKPINGQSIPAYFRVKADGPDGFTYVEGAERYFTAEQSHDAGCSGDCEIMPDGQLACATPIEEVTS